jgi:hypothetical protein
VDRSGCWIRLVQGLNETDMQRRQNVTGTVHRNALNPFKRLENFAVNGFLDSTCPTDFNLPFLLVSWILSGDKVNE